MGKTDISKNTTYILLRQLLSCPMEKDLFIDHAIKSVIFKNRFNNQVSNLTTTTNQKQTNDKLNSNNNNKKK